MLQDGISLLFCCFAVLYRLSSIVNHLMVSCIIGFPPSPSPLPPFTANIIMYCTVLYCKDNVSAFDQVAYRSVSLCDRSY